jgi:hypothetical protein
VDVLITAQAVLSGLVGLAYAVAWARLILGDGLETISADLRRRTRGEAHLPRLPRPLRLLTMGYVVPMLVSMLVLCLVDVPGDALFATAVTVPGHLFMLLIVGALGVLVVMPVLGLWRIARGGRLRQHATLAAVLLLILMVVPWATLGTWAAESPYEGSRSPDWLLLLGIQRDGVQVRNEVALRLTQVMTYLVAGLLLTCGWLVRRGWASSDDDRTDLRGPDAP